MSKFIRPVEYQQGYEARLLSPRLPCPYRERSQQGTEWERGYQEADQHYILFDQVAVGNADLKREGLACTVSTAETDQMSAEML